MKKYALRTTAPAGLFTVRVPPPPSSETPAIERLMKPRSLTIRPRPSVPAARGWTIDRAPAGAVPGVEAALAEAAASTLAATAAIAMLPGFRRRGPGDLLSLMLTS